MLKDTSDSWLKFLNPESLKSNLIRSSIFLTCWETLKDSITTHPRTFFLDRFEGGKWITDPKYKTEVLALDNDPLIAAAMWFRNQGAISDDDIFLLREFRKHRNEIAHELQKFLGTAESNIQMEYFDGMLYLDAKINKWWIQNFELPINPDFYNRELTQEELDGVMSMSTILMDVLVSVAKGDEDRLQKLYEGMKEHVENAKRTKTNTSEPVPKRHI